MEDVQRLLRTVGTDRRIWGVTLFLVGWPAFGVVSRIGFVQESATPIVYAYLLAANAVVPGFPGDVLFWVGFVVFCFGVAVVLVGMFDWLRTRSPLGDRREQRTTE